MSNNINTEGKLRKFLKDEVSSIIFFIGFVASIIWFSAGIRQDIALIQKDLSIIRTNELVHIQNGIDENKERGNNNANLIQDINLKLERILVILEKE